MNYHNLASLAVTGAIGVGALAYARNLLNLDFTGIGVNLATINTPGIEKAHYELVSEKFPVERYSQFGIKGLVRGTLTLRSEFKGLPEERTEDLVGKTFSVDESFSQVYKIGLEGKSVEEVRRLAKKKAIFLCMPLLSLEYNCRNDEFCTERTVLWHPKGWKPYKEPVEDI